MKKIPFYLILLVVWALIAACKGKNSATGSQAAGTNPGNPAIPSTSLAITENTVQISAESGGYVELTGVRLSIPQGALEEDTEIHAELTDISASANSTQIIGKGIRLEPEGLQFLKPAEIEICYAAAAVAGLNEKSTLIYYQDDSGNLVAIAGTTDTARHCVSGTIEHFSSYVAAAYAMVPGNTAPNIGGANFLPSALFAGIPLRVRTAINDVNGGANPGNVVSAFLYYRNVGAPSFNKVPLLPDTTDNTVTNRYFFQIPANEVTLAGIEYYFEATDNLNAKRTTAINTRTVPTAATALRFNPTGNLTISSGFKRALTLQASDGGAFRNISLDNQTVSNPVIGTAARFSPSAVQFNATGMGSGVISATAGGLTAATNATVVPGLLSSIALTDQNQVTVTGPYQFLPQQTFQFDVVGYDAYGNMAPILGAFSTTGSIGAITAQGLFTAGTTPGSGTVAVNFGSFSQWVTISVDPAQIVSTTPANSATNTAITSQIQVTFNAAMDASTFNAGNIIISDGFAVVPGAFVYGGLTATFTPASALNYGLTYSVTLTTGVKDIYGNNLAAPYTFSFSTTPLNLPSTTASPRGGGFTSPQVVTLTCQNIYGGGCARMVYTTDGTVPSFSPVNGTIVTGNTATLNAGAGDNTIRYMSENNAGLAEPYKETVISVSTTGYVFVGHGWAGISRGIGQYPASFVKLVSGATPNAVFYDEPSGLLLAGAQDGLYISTDLGNSWARRSQADGLLNNYFYDVIAYAGVIYAGTGGGISISTDRGKTFSNRTPANGLGNTVYSLAVANGKLIAGTDVGVSISPDNGTTFTTRTTAAGLGSDTINALATDGNIIYAATTGGLSISTNGGTSFVNSTTVNGLSTNVIYSVAACSGRIYAGPHNGLFVSADGGSTFTPLSAFPSYFRAEKIRCFGNSVFVGTTQGLYVSADQGLTFVTKSTVDGLPSRYVKSLSLSGTKVFVATQGSGVGISQNGGISFTAAGAMANGFGSQGIQRFQYANGKLYVATSWGASVSSDGGGSFVNISDARGLTYGNTRKVFADGANLYVATSGGGLGISTDNGNSFIMKGPLGGFPSGTSNINAVAADGVNIYAATDKGLYVSNDGGNTFNLRFTGRWSPPARDVTVKNGIVYVIAQNQVSYSSNLGSTFTEFSYFYGSGVEFSSVFVNPLTTLIYFGSWSAGLWAGVTSSNQVVWFDSTSDGLPTNAVSDVFERSDIIYAATQAGLSISNNWMNGTYTIRTTTHGLADNYTSAVVYVP